MFAHKTVFVVGAGASREAGLPTGPELVARLAEHMNFQTDTDGAWIGGEKDLRQLLIRRGNGAELCMVAERIAKGVRLSHSIDEYLHRFSQAETVIETCGKAAIVYEILTAERGSDFVVEGPARYGDLKRDAFHENWYPAFARSLFQGVGVDDQSQVFSNVSVISFNYDRCLEHFFRYAIRDGYDVTIEAAEAIVEQFVILRPYGSVGSLRTHKTQNGIDYGADPRNVSIVELGQNIRTYSEQVRDETTIAKIRSELSEAHTIVFLGFSFHPDNMKLLAPEAPPHVSRLYATAYGLSGADQAIIQSELQAIFQPVSLRLFDGKCHAFFDQYANTLRGR